jgi:DNA-directed RNA polymerase specialized sigma subunit
LSTLHTAIEKHIKKLIHPLKEEEALLPILKVKLTKKELKLLRAWAEESSREDIQTTLSLDEERYSQLSTKLIKKLNQERIKQAICI